MKVKTFIKRFSESEFNTPSVKGVLIFCFAVYVLMVAALGYAWYSNQLASGFHFFNDMAEWKQMDKFAHFFWTSSQFCFQSSGYFLCQPITSLIHW